jgi:hypothetical protein
VQRGEAQNAVVKIVNSLSAGRNPLVSRGLETGKNRLWSFAIPVDNSRPRTCSGTGKLSSGGFST